MRFHTCLAAMTAIATGAYAQVWTETQILAVPADATPVSSFGFYSAVDDRWVATLSNGVDNRVLFLERVGPGEWIERQAVVPSPTSANAIAMSGSVVVLGQGFFSFPESRGIAMIMERNDGGVWSQTTVLQPDDLLPSARFGSLVAASGDRIAVQASFVFSSQPRDAIYVYRREGFGQWVLEDRIPLFEGNDFSERYTALEMAMDGDTITLFEGSGFKGTCSLRFEAYERDENNQWTLRTRVQEDNQPCGEFSMALVGNIAVVGDSALQNNTGGARIYRRSQDGSWIRGENLIPADVPPVSFVGTQLAFDGQSLLLTTPFGLSNRFFAFELQPDGTFADLGPQASVLFPPDANVGYGQSIGIDGNDVVVGVPRPQNAFPDKFETGVIASYTRNTTDQDTDGDGLPDEWETDGIPYAKTDGTTGRLILPQADPLRKNLYIEVDAALIPMPDSAITLVIQAFAQAPVTNPDGSTGITLHIQIDENQVPTPNAVVTGDTFPENFTTLRERHFGTIAEQQDTDSAALLAAKAKAYRWCFAYSGIQFAPGTAYFGRGSIPGPSFLIDLDNDLFDVVLHPNSAPQEIASTFMHEFGHTLGLRHGGVDNIHGKPNYPSVMNYALTHITPWNRSFRRLDFSREALATLDESALVESRGINSAKYRRYRMPFGTGPDLNRRFSFVRLTGRATDFNGDGVRQGTVEQDLNFMPTIDFAGVTNPSPGEPLPGQNDWSVIQYAPPVGRGGEESSGCTNPAVYEFLTTQIPPPCEVDLDENGIIDFFDVAAFLQAFNAQDGEADLAEPFDTLDAADVQAYISAFLNGCP